MKRIVVFGSFARSLVNFRGPLIRRLVDDGHCVFAVAPEEPSEITTEIEALGAKYRSIPMVRTGLNPLSDFNTLFATSKLFRELKADLVLAYTIKPVIYGSLAARLANVPHIYSIITGLGYSFGTGTKKQVFVNRLVTLLYRRALKLNRLVFFQNPDDQNLFLEKNLIHAKQGILVNGSGVDLNQFSMSLQETHRPTFLLIARLIKEKGIREYAEAARVLKQKYEHADFQLVGPYDSNPMRVTPEEVISWTSSGYIKYLGEVTDVRPILSKCDVFVLPSFYREGVPRTLLEAMAMGKPVITTDMPGCRETVSAEENGILIPPRDVHSLILAMERFIVNPPLINRMGIQSRRIAEEKFDVHKVNARLVEAMDLSHSSF